MRSYLRRSICGIGLLATPEGVNRIARATGVESPQHPLVVAESLRFR